MMFSRKLISMKTTYKMFFTLKSPSIPLTLSVLTVDPDKDILKLFFCIYIKMMIIPLLITMMSLPGVANNITSADIRPLAHHPLHKGWLCHSIIGAIGLFLNSLVIVILFLERNSLISSINVTYDCVCADRGTVSLFYVRS